MARSATVDPLEKFRFQVTFTDGSSSGSDPTTLDRAGFFEVQMPKRSTTKIQYREGNDPDIRSVSAGLSSMEDITLGRGVIKSSKHSSLYKWMSSVHTPTAGLTGAGAKTADSARPAGAAQADYRKDVTILIYNREGVVAKSYVLYNAFVVNFVPGSDLNAGEDGDKLLESITISYEDFKETTSETP